MIFILKASVRYPSASFFSVQVAIVLLKRFHWLPMDLGLVHVLYICNNMLDTGAAWRDLCISKSITERAN